MPQPFSPEYGPIPDEVAHIRAPLRAGIMRQFQRNAQHLHGTRLRQLVSDVDLWVTPPAGAFSTEPEYLVTVSDDATRLYGAVLWGTVRALDEHGAVFADGQVLRRMGVRFYSERGGAGVAAALDTVTTAETIDDLTWGQLRSADWPTKVRQLAETQNMMAVKWSGVGGGSGAVAWIEWTPTLTTSREQRVQVQVRDRSLVDAGNLALWGVAIWEGVPQG